MHNQHCFVLDIKLSCFTLIPKSKKWNKFDLYPRVAVYLKCLDISSWRWKQWVDCGLGALINWMHVEQNALCRCRAELVFCCNRHWLFFSLSVFSSSTVIRKVWKPISAIERKIKHSELCMKKIKNTLGKSKLRETKSKLQHLTW